MLVLDRTRVDKVIGDVLIHVKNLYLVVFVSKKIIQMVGSSLDKIQSQLFSRFHALLDHLRYSICAQKKKRDSATWQE